MMSKPEMVKVMQNYIPEPESPSERRNRIRASYGLEPKTQQQPMPASDFVGADDRAAFQARVNDIAQSLGIPADDPELARARRQYSPTGGQYWDTITSILEHRANERQWAAQDLYGDAEEAHRAPEMAEANNEIDRICQELGQIHSGAFGSPTLQSNQDRRAALRKKLAAARRG